MTFVPDRGPSADRSAEWARTASSLARPTLDTGPWSAFGERAASSSGGGVFIESGTMGDVWLMDSTIENNTTGDDGGGAWLVGDAVLVTDSLVEGNSAFDSGGLHMGGHGLEVTTTTFSTNVASQQAGGLYAFPLDHVDVDTVTLSRNEAAYGVGLHLSGASASAPALVSAVTFDGNAGWRGGGV